MELLQLRYFQTVAKMESITDAAKYYRIPKSSMSQTRRGCLFAASSFRLVMISCFLMLPLQNP